MELPYEIIIISGKAASGKSYYGKLYEKKGYYLISCDELVRKLYKKFEEGIPKDDIFMIYQPTKNYDQYEDIKNNKKWKKYMRKAKKYFVRFIKKKIKKHKKVVIEGTIKDIDMIKDILGHYRYKFLFVKPKDEKIYLQNLTDRFVESPDNYGRIGFIGIKDKDKEGVLDYKKNGINGEKISKLLKNVASEQYIKIRDLHEYYAEHFYVKLVNNKRELK